MKNKEKQAVLLIVGEVEKAMNAIGTFADGFADKSGQEMIPRFILKEAIKEFLKTYKQSALNRVGHTTKYNN